MDQQLSIQISELQKQVGEMHVALMGSNMTKDGGLVGRITDLEKKVEELDDDIEALEAKIDELNTKDMKFEIYQKLLWSAAGFIVCALIALFLQNIYKH